jgi:hypothetical protein
MIGTHTASFGDEVWLVIFCVKQKNGRLLEWTINGAPIDAQ